jgi:transcriptional regulator with PAS, ATPase and Fis domain
LRALEEQEFYPVGGNELVRVDVRIIASTNRDLKAMVEAGSFREDLFFRLNVYKLKIPPLRQRPQDIASLAEYFMQQFNRQFGKRFREISKDAQEILLLHAWKGNGRELRNVIERVVLFADDSAIKKEHLYFIETPAPAKASNSSFQLPETGISLEEVEKSLIEQALKLAKHNKTKAAKLLHLTLPTFYYRLQKYGLN